jgi:S1-C subfamily serine protease
MQSWWAKGGALVAAALLGGIVAVAVGQAFGSDSTTTVVREVQAGSKEPAAFHSSGGKKISDIYEAAKHGVVQVTSTSVVSNNPFLGPQEQQAQGSGFVIDKDGHVVTNYHVIQGAKKVQVSFSDNDQREATVVGADPSTDIAVLKIQGSWARSLTPLSLGDSRNVKVGDAVVAIGNPFGLERTVTAGIVSALQRQITAPNNFQIDEVIQTDAAINHGNSGGPLLNANGDVIGVNAQIESESGGNVGIGFAIPIDTVKDVAGELIKHGKVEHAFLGIEGKTLQPNIARLFHLPVTSGVLVASVRAGSGAAKAGLKAATTQVTVAGESWPAGGDVIVKVDAQPVPTIEKLIDLIATKKPGDRIDLDVVRGTNRTHLNVKLGRQP